jgi:hypothetical protein
MNVTFTLTTSNTASGPFNISGTTSGGALNGVLIENDISKAELLAGHLVENIIDTVTGGTITSVGVGTCNGTVKDWFVYPQSVTLSYNFSAGQYYFYLSEAILDDITILTADVYGHTTSNCGEASADTATIQSPVVFTAGLTTISHNSEVGEWSSINHIQPRNQMTFDNYGYKTNGQTFTTPSGTVVTVQIDTTCQVYNT